MKKDMARKMKKATVDLIWNLFMHRYIHSSTPAEGPQQLARASVGIGARMARARMSGPDGAASASGAASLPWAAVPGCVQPSGAAPTASASPPDFIRSLSNMQSRS
eukprot:gene10419-8369_t